MSTTSRSAASLSCMMLASPLAALLVFALHAADAERGALRAAERTAAAGKQAAGKQPALAAVVNAEPITHKQLGEESLRRYGEDVLQAMINKHLILQACRRQGVEITLQDVDEEVRRIAAKFGLSVERYLQMLREERDISSEEYRRDIVWPMLALRRLVAEEIAVTPEEFNQAYTSEFGEKVKCRMIMVSSREKAARLREQAIAAPDEFGQLAKDHSEDEVSASVRGIIPPIRRHTGDDQLEEIAFNLAAGEISELFQLGDQWLLLQCVRQLPATPPAAQLMPAIRQRITDQIRDQKMRGSAGNLFQELQQQAQVVNVLNDPALRGKHPGVAALVNGQPLRIADVTEECIKRHGRTVLDGEINRKVLQQALQSAGRQVAQADLDAEIARAADTYGYVKPDGTPDVDRWLKTTLAEEGSSLELYIRDAVWPTAALKKLVEGTVQVTDEDLRKGFESNYGPRAEVLAIVLSDQRTAQEVWEMARSNPTEKFFSDLAWQYSVEPVSQSNHGKVPPLRRYGGQPAVEQEAFALKPGELSSIIATGDQYVILHCQGFTEPIVTDPKVVRDELVRDLQEKKTRIAMAEKFDTLYAAAQIDNFLSGESQTGSRVATPQAAPARR